MRCSNCGAYDTCDFEEDRVSVCACCKLKFEPQSTIEPECSFCASCLKTMDDSAARWTQHADIRVWDLYAAHALSGVLASPLRQYLNSGEIARSVAKDADALLAERRRRMGQVAGVPVATSDESSDMTGGEDL